MTDTDPVEAVGAALLANTSGREHEPWPSVDADEFRNKARAAIAAHLEALEAAGYAVVPKKPTFEMTNAAFDAAYENSDNGLDCQDVADPIYRAMLAAAPEGPTS